jgi:tRNA (guanine-N7-)-methyltransferase
VSAPQDAPHRPIRTYALRATRARGARRAPVPPLAQLGRAPLDLDALFGRRVPRAGDFGCGTGESLLALAEARPEWDFLGVEVYGAGIARALGAAQVRGLRNVRVLRADVREVLAALPDGALEEAWVLFPDP